jgi:hypothetical protein
MSIEDLDKIIPVTPPIVNKIIKPINHKVKTVFFIFVPYNLDNQLNTLIPVGIPITIVAAVKYARLSTSIPIVYI